MASDFVRNIKGIRNIDILSPNITTENDLISTSDGEVYVVTNKGYRKITGVETKEIKQLKTDVSNVKIQSDTNTLNISNLTDDIETNTSEIETLKTNTDNNTSEIETLKTSTDNNTSDIETNTSEIETLKTSTDNNTSEIETLNTTTDNNTSEIETLKTTTDNNTSEISDLKIAINNNKVLLFNGSANTTGDVITLNQSYEDFTELKIKFNRANTNQIFNFDTEDETSLVFSYANVFDDNSEGKIYEMIIDKISPTELEIESQRAITFSGESSDNSAITILKIWGVK